MKWIATAWCKTFKNTGKKCPPKVVEWEYRMDEDCSMFFFSLLLSCSFYHYNLFSTCIVLMYHVLLSSSYSSITHPNAHVTGQCHPEELPPWLRRTPKGLEIVPI